MEIFITSFILSLLLTNYFIPIFNKSIIDIPNLRSSHREIKPTGGGVIFFTLVLIYSFFLDFKLPICCIPLVVLGLIDDRYKINALIRYLVQILTILLILYIIQIDNFNPIISNEIWLSIGTLSITLIFGTGMINLINFMDGIDGLVAGSMIIVFSTICFVLKDTTLIPIIGTLIGFIFWNWEPAKIFMGDAGSTFLGAIYAGIILSTNNINQSIFMILINTPLLADSIICIIRRLIAKQNIFKPHRLHLYQRLYQAGWSHSKISILYIFATSSLSILYILFGLNILVLYSIIIISIGIWIDNNIAAPFILTNSYK